MRKQHIAGDNCPLCDEKLLKAHSYLAQWFQRVKDKYPEIHVSWAYRDKDAQEAAYSSGRSLAEFPKSPHNKEPSMALDLFTINSDGRARFPTILYAKIATDNEQNGEPIIWGGTFKNISDPDHFELDKNHEAICAIKTSSLT